MTNLTRPVAGDPLSSSNGKASTVIIDEAFDLVEANESKLTVRTSPDIITTDSYTDTAEVLLAGAETTTGWHVTGGDRRAGTATISSGTATLTAVTGTFASGDAGTIIRIAGAGVAGADLRTTVATFTDTTHIVLSTTAGTSVVGAVWDLDPGPSLNTVHNQGSNSVQGYLIGASGAGNQNNALYVNLAEVGYPTGLDVLPGQVISVDILLSGTAGYSPFYGAFQSWAVTIGTDTTMATGTKIQNTLTADETNGMILNTWYTIRVPVGALTNIKSIGIKKVSALGSSANRARFHVDNVRVTAYSAIDKAYHSDTSVAVMVPPSYAPSITQAPILPDSLKSLVDFRPDHAWAAGWGGVRNIREWQLDETGVTDMTAEFQAALDSLDEGEVLELPPTGIFRVDNGLQLNVDRTTLDGNGAALIQRDVASDYVGVKVAASTIPRVNIMGNGVTVRNLRIFGSSITPSTPSAGYTLSGGAAVVGSTITMAALNAAATSPTQWLGRDHLGRIRIDYTLSDTTQVANDFVVTFTDGNGTVLSTTAQTLTSTPTVYSFFADLRDLFTTTIVSLKKNTATANTITVAGARVYNNMKTSWLNVSGGADYENGHGIKIGADVSGSVVTRGGDNCTIENVLIESVQSDGINLSNGIPSTGVQNSVVKRVLVRGNGRQTFVINGGQNHRWEDLVSIYSGRHGVDFEPEFDTTTAVGTTNIRNMVIWEATLVPAFQSGANFPRVRNITVDGLRIYQTGGGYINGKFMNSTFKNLELRDPSNPVVGGTTSNTMGGHNNIWENVVIDGSIQIGDSAAVPLNDENLVSYTPGGVIARNITFKTTQPGGYIDVQGVNTHLENIRVEPNIPVVDPAASAGSIGLLADTTYDNIDLLPLRTSLAVTYPGVAANNSWFPSGLDLRNEGLSRTAYISGSSTKGNNLGRFAQAVTAGSTTLTVAFPARAYINFSNFTLASSTGGTLTPATTYYYRVAGRSRRGGPMLAAAEKNVTLTAGTGNAATVTLTTNFTLASGIAIAGATIYRGTAAATYNTRYDIVPTRDISGWAGSVVLKDLGTSMTLSTGFAQGYSFPYAAVAGATVPVDETGFEPDVNYALFVETSWQTTWKASAKRTNGFDLEFGVACPVGGGTINWMIARF